MRFVERADIRPHYCIVFPHLGSDHSMGYIDTGNEITAIDPHAYVSVVAVEEMAKLIGYPTREAHAEAVSEVARLSAELEQERAARADAERALDAIDALESRGFRERKKPGRPAKKQSAEEVV